VQIVPVAVDTASVTDTIQKSQPETTPVKNEPKGEIMLYHTVKSGEFLGMVADLYDCNVSEVKKWNKLRSDRLNSGQKLKVYVPAARQSYYKKINSMSAAEKKRIVNQD
jgi:LysM repeat protein